MHRDIKPDNIFIDLSEDSSFADCEEEKDFIDNLDNFSPNTKFTVKIGDLGVSKSTDSLAQETV